jgi:DNA-binding CsgD family transcriptional regulator
VEPGEGLAWVAELMGALRGAQPPVALVIAPDLSGGPEALAALAASIDRPAVRIVPIAAESEIPLAALRSLDGALVPGDVIAAREALLAAHAGSVLVVDDAHWLDDESLVVLAGLAARADAHDLGLLVCHRPSATGALAALDEAMAGAGPVARADVLTADEVAARLAVRTGRATTDALVAAVLEATAGRLGLVDLLVDGWGGAPPDLEVLGSSASPPEAVVSAMRLRVARLPDAARQLVALLALAPAASDELIAAVAAVDPSSVGSGRAALRDAGLLDPGGDAVVPVVAGAVLASTEPEVRRDLERRLGHALAAEHGSVGAAAALLASAGASGPVATAQYRAAAVACAADDPLEALRWYERALAAGGDPVEQAAEQAELVALTGDLDGALRWVDTALESPDEANRRQATRVAGVVAFRRGQVGQALQFFDAAASAGDDTARSLGALVGLGVGRPAPEASDPEAAGDLAARGAGLAAQAARRAVELDPAAGHGDFLEVGTLVAASGRVQALVESPWVIGAICASIAGDRPAALDLLTRARAAAPAGLHRPAVDGWSAWLERPPDADDPPAVLGERDRLVEAAVAARRARRSGDLGALHDAWQAAEALVLAVQPDLWLLEPAGELAAASSRLDPYRRALAWLDVLDDAARTVEAAAAWRVALAWARLQVGLAADAPDEVAAAAAALASLGDAAVLGVGPRASVTAAAAWAEVVEGRVDPEQIERAAADLVVVGRQWDASRLVGQAAVRTTDPAVARSLLVRARELAGAEGGTEDGSPPEGGRSGVLSEREVEVSRLVLEGRTHKEIGAQLFLSPKTVEHHVARIRTKLGAATRAEMIAALHRELD